MDVEFDVSMKALLEPGETVRWQGKIGFNFASTVAFVVAFYALAGYVFWAFWGSYSLDQFCPPEDKISKCGSVYVLIPPLLLLMAISISFDMLERRAILSGNSKGLVLLTDRRIIRVSDWPWRRIRAYNYHSKPERVSWARAMRFGSTGSVILNPNDIIEVRRLMQSGRGTP